MQTVSIVKFFAYLFLVSVTLVMLVLGLALSPLGVSVMVNFANDQSGVKVGQHSGSLYSRVQFEQFDYANQELHIFARNIDLDIGINCLILGKACIQNLSVEKLNITQIPSAEQRKPVAQVTEYMSLPIEIVVDALSIKQFALFKDEVADRDSVNDDIVNNSNANLQARLPEKQKVLSATDFKLIFNAKDQVIVKQLSVGDLNFYTEELNKELNKQEAEKIQNPAAILAQIANFEYKGIIVPDVFVPINIRVDQVRAKTICLQSASPVCTANTQASASVSQQKVKLTMSTDPFKQIVSKVQMVLQIDLAEQFTHKLTATINPNITITGSMAKPLNINLLGNIEQTQLVVSIEKENRAQKLLDLQAAFDLRSANLPADIQLQSTNVTEWVNAWLPNIAISVNSIDVSLKGDTLNYTVISQLELQAQQTSIINIDANVSLQNKTLRLKRLQSQGGIGDLLADAQVTLNKVASSKVAGKAHSAIAHTLTVNAAIDFSKLKLQAIIPDITSDLSGNIKLSGNYVSAIPNPDDSNSQTVAELQSELSGSLTCTNINGSVQGYNLDLACDAVVDKSGLVNVKSFQLLQGDKQAKRNSITGKGKIVLPQGLNENFMQADFTGTQSDFALAVNFQNLSYIYPELLGSVRGDVTIIGGLKQVKVSADLSIDNVALQNIRLETANLSLVFDEAQNWQTELTLRARNLIVSQQIAETISISLKGDMQAHEIAIEVLHSEYSLRHKLSGELKLNDTSTGRATMADPWQWRGIWQEGDWALPFDVLSLSKPIKIKATPRAVALTDHCWKVENTKSDGLCISALLFQDNNLSTQAKLNYDISSVLRYYLSDIVQAGTYVPVESDMTVSYAQSTGLVASVYTLIPNGNLITSRHDIGLMAIVANVEVEKQTLVTNIYAGTKDFGSLGLRSQIMLAPENRQHEGQLNINQIELSPLLQFLPSVEKIAGTINGDLTYSGPIDLPLINGELNITKGELVVDNYPYPISNFYQSVQVNESMAKVKGEFELGDGSGEYDADIDIASGLSIVGNLKGVGMQLAYADNDLLATPNLSFEISPNNIKLSGEIAIPNAQFTLDKLPESARAPSADTIIIGEPAPEPIVPTGLDIDLRLVIDAPKLKRVNIDALDLEASLAGDIRLRVKQEKNKKNGDISPLQTYLNGTINILQGRYEAYGQVLQIRRGDIYFSGPPSLPQFDISAIRNPLNTADQVIAGIRISGNPVIPKVELFSEPPMIQARQLSYLLQGTNLDGGNGNANDVLLVNMLVGFGVGGSENRVNKLGKSLGFDSLNIRTAGQGNNTQFQVTGRISDNIQVTYGVGLFDSASEVILKYQLLPKLYLEAKSGANSALDLFYEVSRGE